MPVKPELIPHESPCQYFLAHKQGHEKTDKEIDDLKLCYTKLVSIESDQKQALRTQEEFKQSHTEMKESMASQSQILALQDQRAAQILNAIADLTDSLKNVEKRTLTEDKIRVMVIEISKSFVTEDVVDRRIAAGVKEAVAIAVQSSHMTLWKMVGLSITGSSLLLGLLGLGYRIVMRGV